MPKNILTQYAVDELVAARKIAGRTRSIASAGSSDLLVDLRRADAPGANIGLLFLGSVPPKPPSGLPRVQRPSASLLFHSQRIRGIDWTIKHEIVRNGVPAGEFIKGWHENYWTTTDGCKAIRAPNPIPQNEDLPALIEWCCEQWNIEGIQESMRLFS